MERQAVPRHHDAERDPDGRVRRCGCGWATASAAAGCTRSSRWSRSSSRTTSGSASSMRDFAADRNTHGDVFYRWINEIPALPILVARRVPRRHEAVLSAMERFFAPCPRGLEARARRRARTRSARGEVAPTDGGVGFAGDARARLCAPTSSRASRAASCGASAAARTATSTTLYELAQGDRLDAALPRRRARCASTSRRRARRCTSLEFATLRSRTRCATASAPTPACARRSTSARPTCASAPTSPSATRRSTSTRRASRCSSAATGATPTRRRCARTSPPGLVALPAGQPGTALLDPMCGSGTIAIEAALIAADRAPGLARTFGFQKLAWFDGPTWQRMKQARARPREDRRRRRRSLFASDIARRRGREDASEPARRAGRRASSRVEQADVLARRRARADGVLVANPPYGVRLADQERSRRSIRSSATR